MGSCCLCCAFNCDPLTWTHLSMKSKLCKCVSANLIYLLWTATQHQWNSGAAAALLTHEGGRAGKKVSIGCTDETSLSLMRLHLHAFSFLEALWLELPEYKKKMMKVSDTMPSKSSNQIHLDRPSPWSSSSSSRSPQRVQDGVQAPERSNLLGGWICRGVNNLVCE